MDFSTGFAKCYQCGSELDPMKRVFVRKSESGMQFFCVACGWDIRKTPNTANITSQQGESSKANPMDAGDKRG